MQNMAKLIATRFHAASLHMQDNRSHIRVEKKLASSYKRLQCHLSLEKLLQPFKSEVKRLNRTAKPKRRFHSNFIHCLCGFFARLL